MAAVASLLGVGNYKFALKEAPLWKVSTLILGGALEFGGWLIYWAWAFGSV